MSGFTYTLCVKGASASRENNFLIRIILASVRIKIFWKNELDAVANAHTEVLLQSGLRLEDSHLATPRPFTDYAVPPRHSLIAKYTPVEGVYPMRVSLCRECRIILGENENFRYKAGASTCADLCAEVSYFVGFDGLVPDITVKDARSW
ncbi:1209_t:CDS:2 [Funneliformis mosseae]|uniref:1209_t:CDS:1 n=1 Tax=Funneliformis mosseae TaxID=27381 RepID=A0A9N9ABZ9_FUNMO|nr:1209_t:CDS:2 [Funneliformis mosseae]